MNGRSAVATPGSEAGNALGMLTPTVIKNAFTEIMDDEARHVSFFQEALRDAGPGPRPAPTFKGLRRDNQNDFAAMSRVLENTGVAAFLMALPAISDKNYRAAAASIVTIEARHAGFVDVLLGTPLSENGAFDKPTTQADIVKAVSPFVQSLNGGPDPAAPLTNDIEILNFALFLEHLEADFYRVNVPTLFK